MRAPRFWQRRGAAATLLTPLGWIFAGLAGARFAAARSWRAPVPVLCVGNLVAGGAGKTPLALALGARLMGRQVHFLSRGYGGAASGPLRVDVGMHTAAAVGDEALLLAAVAPTWVGRDRVAGARAAAAAGAGLLIMDDGFQNPSLAKDLSIVAVDGAYGFGNGRVLPAGPLREPVGRGLARADAVCILGADDAGVAAVARRAGSRDLAVLGARLEPGPEAARLSGRRVVAFAGIGRPEKFFASLEAIGCRLVETHAFADHHAYAPAELERLRAAAADAGAVCVTTAKDQARIGEDQRGGIEVLTVAVRWDDEASVDAFLGRLDGG